MKKFINFIVLFSIILFSGCGWGWFVPYSFRPSYWGFKKMCEVSSLPNNKEKYNKLLGYYGMSLDTLDWEKLNKWHKEKLDDTYSYKYKITIRELSVYPVIVIYSNQSIITKDNIEAMRLIDKYYTNRYYINNSLKKEVITLGCWQV